MFKACFATQHAGQGVVQQLFVKIANLSAPSRGGGFAVKEEGNV